MTLKTIIDITVSPKSSRSMIAIKDTEIKVYLNAPPIDGKANSELIGIFSKTLRIPKSDITIIAGAKGKKKRVSIDGLSLEIVMQKLRNH